MYLLNAVHLEKTNNQTIATVFNDSMHILWPDRVEYENVLLLVTDAAPYMKRAAQNLQAIYHRMIHVCYFAHALHRICEEIRTTYPLADNSISTVKKIFLKAPYRIVVFKEHNSTLCYLLNLSQHGRVRGLLPRSITRIILNKSKML